MELNHRSLLSGSAPSVDGTVPLDVLRALVIARQAATPTAQAVAVAGAPRAARNLDMLFFASRSRTPAMWDGTVGEQDERHG
jgi:hypothetical protein